MIFEKTKIEGAYLIKQQPFQDERGSFARIYCKNEFEKFGIAADFVQANLSKNNKKGTLRGLHAQRDGYEEEKLVSCCYGALLDVCLDVRADSASYGQYITAELSAENGNMLLIPKGCAHGYLTLEDNTQALYYVSQFYTPNCEIGYRYNDPAFHIEWPKMEEYIISDKDRQWSLV